MREHESQNATPEADVLRPLCRSLLAVRCVFVICTLLSVFSSFGFVFQALYKDEFGESFRDQPGAWPHLLGHLLRGTVGAGLAWCLWRYLRIVKKSIRANQREAPELFAALARWWNGLAISGVALVLYGTWVAFVTGPPIVSRPLSPRFRAEPPDRSVVRVEFRLAEDSRSEGLIEAQVAGTSATIFLHKEALLTNRDIADARVVLNEDEEPVVDVRFVKAAQQKMREATESHRGKRLAILVDDKVITAPVIRWQIGEGAWIQGAFTREEAERIAIGLSGRK